MRRYNVMDAVALGISGLALLAVGMIAGLGFRLKRQQQKLTEWLDIQNRDLAGLSVASARVDEKLLVLEGRIETLTAQMAEIEAVNETARPYHGVIQQVRHGASAEQLVKNFAISREEAALLIRLHRGNQGHVG